MIMEIDMVHMMRNVDGNVEKHCGVGGGAQNGSTPLPRAVLRPNLAHETICLQQKSIYPVLSYLSQKRCEFVTIRCGWGAHCKGC